jgi:hypothetical protein
MLHPGIDQKMVLHPGADQNYRVSAVWKLLYLEPLFKNSWSNRQKNDLLKFSLVVQFSLYRYEDRIVAYLPYQYMIIRIIVKNSGDKDKILSDIHTYE